MNKTDRPERTKLNREDIIGDAKSMKSLTEIERGLDNPVEVDLKEDPEQTTEQEPVVPIPKKKIGTVYNTPKLHVRKEPSFEAESLGLISKGDKVEVNHKESTEEFYKVTLVSGVDGFCSKNYITMTK